MRLFCSLILSGKNDRLVGGSAVGALWGARRGRRISRGESWRAIDGSKGIRTEGQVGLGYRVAQLCQRVDETEMRRDDER